MTRTRTSVLLTALLVVSAATAGLSGAVVSNSETTYQAQDDGLATVPVDSGDVFWQGQFLRFTAGSDNASEVWSIRRVENGEVGDLVTEVLLDGEGSAVFATGGLRGRYVVVNENEEPVVVGNGTAQSVGTVNEASFDVANQTLDATFTDLRVTNDDGQDARTDLRLESNRAGYRVFLASEQLSASEVAEVFSSAEVRDDRAVVTRQISGDEVLDANFTGVEPGTYNFTVFALDGTAQDEASITVTEPIEGTASLENTTVIEQRGDVARFNVTFDGTDRATVTVGSQQVGYRSRFLVRDVNGDGVATVVLDTYRAGISTDSPGISVVGEDNYTNFQLVTDPIPDVLDAATYPIEVSVGGTRTAVGSILLSERSTGGIQVWTAPDPANVGSPARIAEVATQDSDIAYQDWAIVQVQASGLYSYVQDLSDLNNDSTGLSMTLTQVGEINVPPEEVSLERGELVVDEENDQFFLVFDSNTLTPNATYSANFTISDANPYVEPGNGTSLVANFTTVPREVSLDRPIEVSASSEATLSGDSTLAPGTEISVEVANTGRNPFLRRSTATVQEDGSWEATFDLSGVPAGTNFTVSITDPAVRETGGVVAGDAGEDDQATETEEADETTTAGEETTTEAETTAEGEAGAETTVEEDTETTTEAEATAEDAATETPAEEGTTETATETTTVEASAPASGFGPVPLLVGVVALLTAAALVARRR
ncbi:BGTF surface domain-containing protein [Halorussus lipolyticus]|uniref:BGTF surface domain-containing protein n=1 Tax=Halorussus lipolyticus TaxID=3034024 RepID=UPI0023E76753|nr:BGTF surface domain-containing protein [Halorussus sp. DT80]